MNELNNIKYNLILLNKIVTAFTNVYRKMQNTYELPIKHEEPLCLPSNENEVFRRSGSEWLRAEVPKGCVILYARTPKGKVFVYKILNRYGGKAQLKWEIYPKRVWRKSTT